MNISISALIYLIVFEVNLTVARYNYIIEDSLQMPCENTQQCEDMGWETYTCVDQLCLCEEGKKCGKIQLQTTVTKIGQNCIESSECNIAQSFCNNEGNCDCIPSTISSNNKRTCLNVSDSLGSLCEENVQCSLLNGICKNKRCCCGSKMHGDKGICFKNVELGYPCDRDEECSAIDFSSCKFNKCTCHRRYIKSKTSSKCLLKARNLLSICVDDIQCKSVLGDGSTCRKGFCTCGELFHHKADINKCVIDIRLGENCRNHSDCHQPGGGESRLKCILGECKCQPNYFEDAGFCISNSCNGKMSFSLRDILPYLISYVFCYVIV